MKGIDLDKTIEFLHSSLRFFSENEHHITRFCKYNVLVMVFEGVLRFAEDNVEYEVYPGQYHIQKQMSYQTGEKASTSPKYLYVHFNAKWADGDNNVLPCRGTFDFAKLKPLMYELDNLSHNEGLLVQKSAKFFELLSILNEKETAVTVMDKIARYIREENLSEISLEKICNKFHYSKNHIINIFKKEFGITPLAYINDLKIRRAKHLLEVTSDTLETIALASGFNNYSHFYKLFYRQTGLSPKEWKKKKHTEPLLQ